MQIRTSMRMHVCTYVSKCAEASLAVITALRLRGSQLVIQIHIHTYSVYYTSFSVSFLTKTSIKTLCCICLCLASASILSVVRQRIRLNAINIHICILTTYVQTYVHTYVWRHVESYSKFHSVIASSSVCMKRRVSVSYVIFSIA